MPPALGHSLQAVVCVADGGQNLRVGGQAKCPAELIWPRSVQSDIYLTPNQVETTRMILPVAWPVSPLRWAAAASLSGKIESTAT